MAAPPRPLDRISGGTLSIDIEHAKIHAGEMFTVHYEGAPSDPGEQTAILFRTPAAADGLVHMTVSVTSNQEALYEIYEGVGFATDNSSTLEIINRKRDSTNTSNMSDDAATPVVGQMASFDVDEAANATFVNSGVWVVSRIIAVASAPPFSIISNTSVRGQREYIWLPETDYAVVLTDRTAPDAIHEIELNWYEAVDKS